MLPTFNASFVTFHRRPCSANWLISISLLSNKSITDKHIKDINKNKQKIISKLSNMNLYSLKTYRDRLLVSSSRKGDDEDDDLSLIQGEHL